MTAMEDQILEAVGEGHADFFAATRLSTGLMGDSIATNLFMVGYAYQKGLIPLSEAAIFKAIEANKVAVDFNKTSFLWGRRAAHGLAAVERVATPAEKGIADSHRLSQGLDELVARRVNELTAYQDAAYARRYTALVERIREVEQAKVPKQTRLTEAVARYYYKLLAYKDEYEVARFYSDSEFMKLVNETFEGDFKLRFHLAPPLLARPDAVSGEPRKRSYGPWMLHLFKLLAKLKGLRGTAFDIFGYSEDRKLERRLLAEYEQMIDELTTRLEPGNYEAAVELASVPELIRGFGHVKKRHVKYAKKREAELLDKFRTRSQPEDEGGEAMPHPEVAMAG
jgi:indolepyruvate ferredoxin oxidoreductase